MTETAVAPPAKSDKPPKSASPLARLRDPSWYQRYGVYVAVAVVLLFNALFTEHFMTADNFRTQLVEVAPIVIVALGMALVIGTEGVDLSVGSTMALAAAFLPLYLGYGLVPALVVSLGGRRRRSRQRRPRLPRRAAAHRGHARALRRRPRTRPRHGRRPAQADRQPRPAVARHRLLPRHSARRLDRRSPRRRRGVPGAAHHLRPAGRRRRRQPFRRRARRAPRQAGPHRRVRDLRGARRARRHPRHRPAHRERPVLARHPHGTLRHHGGRRRRHPLNGGSVRVLGTVAGALLMQLLRATLVKHDLPDSTAQIAQAAIIIAAVYVARERRSR